MNTLNHLDKLSDHQQEDMLDDLDVRCQTNVAAVRATTCRRVHAAVELRPGNACDRDSLLTCMQSSEVSTTGMSGIASKPIMAGSVIHMQFDRSTLDVPPTLAICDRCTMLSDTSFELRFRFTQPIELAGF
jgi:hypothetical protein